jgi:hypothetical protein
MEEHLKSIAKKIIDSQKELSDNTNELRKGDINITDSDEDKLIFKVNGSDLNFKICAVDGGLLSDRLFGADVAVSRSVATCFEYQNSKLSKTDYFPSRHPNSSVDLKNGLDESEAMQFRSLLRLLGEVSCAIEAIEKFKPDYLLIDGSIVLLGSDKPSGQSVLMDEYKSLLNIYKELYEKCESYDCQLVGVIKDSRGKRFVECLSDKLIVNVADTTLADSLLGEMERTCVLPYTKDISKHPVLSNLGEYAEKIKIFYFKPSSEDVPLRIEFLQSKKSINEIADEICTLCSISKAYAYPAALIEADMCAALDPVEMDNVKRSLSALTGGIVKPLRRNSRPFR